jgi:SAM-dependent methyltransferase
MGIGPDAFAQLVDLSTRYTGSGRSLMLGRQAFRLGQGNKRKVTDPSLYQAVLDKFGIKVDAAAMKQDDSYAETMFKDLGFGAIESMDYSGYQNATHVWDLNKPVPTDLHGQFDFIFDGGTLEHVFNVPQAFENVFNMLSVGGVFVGLNPYNGFPSHGMYQFAPELIWTYWKHSCGCDVRTCRAMGREGKYLRDLPDPTELGGRINIKIGAAWRGRLPSSQMMLVYEVQKTAQSRLASDVQQSDYVATWDNSAAAEKTMTQEHLT